MQTTVCLWYNGHITRQLVTIVTVPREALEQSAASQFGKLLLLWTSKQTGGRCTVQRRATKQCSWAVPGQTYAMESNGPSAVVHSNGTWKNTQLSKQLATVKNGGYPSAMVTKATDTVKEDIDYY